MEVATESLLERDRELRSLRALLADARAGDGSVAVVEGPAGIGKTALLEVICALAAGEGFEVLAAGGAELEGEFAFGLVRQLFESRLRRLPPGERADVLSGAAQLAERALGLAATDVEDAPRYVASVHGMYWLAANLGERSPLLLAVDDAQWGDLPSLRWLCYLARRLDGVPLVALVATRPGASPAVAELIDELRRERATRVVTLAPLSEDAVRGLVEGAFGVTAASEFVHACHEQSAGNPLLVRELTTALVADGEQPDATAAQRVLALPPREALRAVLVRLASPAAGRIGAGARGRRPGDRRGGPRRHRPRRDQQARRDTRGRRPASRRGSSPPTRSSDSCTRCCAPPSTRTSRLRAGRAIMLVRRGCCAPTRPQGRRQAAAHTPGLRADR